MTFSPVVLLTKCEKRRLLKERGVRLLESSLVITLGLKETSAYVSALLRVSCFRALLISSGICYLILRVNFGCNWILASLFL